MSCKMVILVRKDLDMGKGKIAAQVAHAAVECALYAYRKKREIFDRWYSEGQRKVVLKVSDEGELLRYHTIARAHGLITALIKDAGHTQLPPGTITCLGIGPDEEDRIDQITGGLPLL